VTLVVVVLAEISKLLGTFGIVIESLVLVEVRATIFSGFLGSSNIWILVSNTSILVIKEVLFISYKILTTKEF
jgi:hypothetical protein